MQNYLKIAIFLSIMSNINITYDYLFEIMRGEKNNNDLNKLPESFYDQVVDYIKEKQDLLKKDDDLFSAKEKKQVLMLLENLDKILTEIYSRREKKVLELALVKSKSRSGLLDTSNMLKSEVLFFEKLLATLDGFRNNILNNVLSAKEVNVNFSDDLLSKRKTETKIVTVRFLEDVDKFVDSDLKEYGPFEKETIATLPVEMAKLLEEQNKLEILDDVF